jgi:hypothetical protein
MEQCRERGPAIVAGILVARHSSKLQTVSSTAGQVRADRSLMASTVQFGLIGHRED